MPFQPGATVYTQGFGSRPESVEVPHVDVRAPSTQDGVSQQFPIGKTWVDTIDGAYYVLTSYSASNGVTTANWALLGTDTGPLNTLSGDSGGDISPSAGNIALAGTSGQIVTTGSGSTITFSLDSSAVFPGDLEVTGNLLVDGTTTTLGATTLATTGASVNTFGNATGATSVGITSGSGGITLTATNAALTANSGTGALSISTDATATTVSLATGAGVKAVTLGSTNTTSSTTVQSGSGALNVTATNGALTINSGTGALSISNDAAATTIAIGTGAAVKGLTIGSTNSTSSTAIQSGSGALTLTSTNGAMTLASGTGTIGISSDATATTVNVATGAGAKTATFGSVNTTSATTVQSGSGALNITSTNGAMTLASGTGEIDISADATATTVKLATGAGAKTLTIGSTNTTSATTIQSGSGDVTVSGGNLKINTAAKQLQVHGGAVTDFIGQATLASGTVDVANTNIAATDRILVTRSAKNASTAYGTPLITITASTKFNITACKSDTTTETNDASTFDYFIVRQL